MEKIILEQFVQEDETTLQELVDKLWFPNHKSTRCWEFQYNPAQN